MPDLLYDIEAERTVLEEIIAKAKEEGIEVSEPIPSTSTSNPLHSPMTGAEVKEVFEVVILVFKTGTAVASFMIAVESILKHFRHDAAAKVTDRASGSHKILRKSGHGK